jgi:FkbM family methyltransferase
MGFLRRQLGRLGISADWHPSKTTCSGAVLVHDVLAVVATRSPLVFDVGAHTGETIRDVLAHAPRARVIAFEPSPKTGEALRRAFGADRRVSIEQCALGDVEARLPFAVTHAHSVNDSLLTMRHEPDAPRVDVAVSTLDAYCARHGVPAIDYLKVDTQGYDLRVLRGARRLLDEKKIRAFSVEVMFDPMYAGQPTLLEMLHEIDERGYEPLGFYENAYLAKNRLSYVNIACVPKRG